MNPNEPSQDAQMPAPSPEPTPPQRNRKKLLFTIGGIVIVLAILIAFAVFGGKKGNDNGSQNGSSNNGDTSLYYDRDGYTRKNLGAGIGDPFAITMAPGKDIKEVGKNTVLPACSVLTLDDLAKSGLRLYANDFGFPVQQSYLAKGEASFAPDANRLPSGSDTMHCYYGIASDNGKTQSVNIEVNQPFTVTDSAITEGIGLLNYQPQADIAGYKVYKRPANATGIGESYMLRKGGDAIEIRFELTDSSKNQNMLQTAAKNLDTLLTKDTGYSVITYKSPTFTESVAKACDYLSNADVKQLTGTDANALIEERWPSATGIADFSKVSNYKTKTNYIRSQCEMTANADGYRTLVGIAKNSIRMTVTSYENDQAALQGLLHITVRDGNDTKSNGPAVGDESYVYKDHDGQQSLAFRQGRFTVELLYFPAKQPDSQDANQYAAQLLPLAKQAADKLKSQK